MVLEEYKLVIEFPRGSTIQIPSAIVTHYNLPIGEDETRFSFVQYAAGGLFRWVDNGFQTAEKVEKKLVEEGKRVREAENQKRWKLGLDLLPKVFEWMPM